MTYHNESYGAGEVDESVVTVRPKVKSKRTGAGVRWPLSARRVHAVALVAVVVVASVTLSLRNTPDVSFAVVADSAAEVNLAALDAEKEENQKKLDAKVRHGFQALLVKQEADRAAAQAAEEATRWEAAQRAATTTTTPPPPPTTTPAPAAPAPVAPEVTSVSAGSVWDDLAWCESRGNWGMNSGNDFYGGLQFMHSTWLNMGGADFAYYPHEASREQQIEVASRLQAQYGWGQWPACSSKLGLR
jgi:biotin carboxyl carrier protein